MKCWYVDEFHNFRQFVHDIPFDFLKLHHSLYMSLHGTWLQLRMAHGDREEGSNMLKWYQDVSSGPNAPDASATRCTMRIHAHHCASIHLSASHLELANTLQGHEGHVLPDSWETRGRWAVTSPGIVNQAVKKRIDCQAPKSFCFTGFTHHSPSKCFRLSFLKVHTLRLEGLEVGLQTQVPANSWRLRHRNTLSLWFCSLLKRFAPL